MTWIRRAWRFLADGPRTRRDDAIAGPAWAVDRDDPVSPDPCLCGFEGWLGTQGCPEAIARSGLMRSSTSGIDLFWLPLGAGGHSVRLNGRVFEAVASRLDGRPSCDLYHSALEVRVPHGRYVIESAPIRPSDGADRGVIGEGPVGMRWAGSLSLFRYELRVWRDGHIPDIGEAVESPMRLSSSTADAQRLLSVAPFVPRPTWGRGELDAGEMWNSNSFIAWLITVTGLDVDAVRPPARGRAPGWDAGVVVARREPPVIPATVRQIAPREEVFG